MTGLSQLGKISRTSSAYPMTTIYISGVALAVTVSQGWVDLNVGLLVFTLITVVAFLVAVMREIRSVRRQLAVQEAAMSAQQLALAKRIDQLIDALLSAGVQVPKHHDGLPHEGEHH